MAYTNDSIWKSVDWMTICIYLMLVIFGWFSVCGASYDYGEIDFFSFDTRAGKQFVWICCSLGLGFILMMLEDKLYDMFAYILYGGMMLLLLITPFLAEDTKGSYSWIKFGPVSLQPAEFAKFATALALAKFMNVYGFTMSKLKYSLPVVGMVLLPMLLIILQRETGSALVYLAFFFMLYREGMPGSILFAGICAVVYFVVGIRFGNELMADDCTSIGEFSVLLLIVILSALLVNSYCKKASVVWYIGGIGVGAYVEDNNHVVMHQGLSKKDVKNIVDWCNERHIGFYLEANSGMYCNDYMLEQGPETMVKYAKGKGASLENAKSSAQHFINGFIHLQGDELYRDDVNKISFILRTYQDHLDSKVDFPHLVANTWGGKGEVALFGDLGPTDITKRNAIEVLLDYLHADPKDTISFGDAKIDLSMFECCAYNVAMGNGGSEIKEAADYITDDVNEDGLYNAFKYLKLI